MLVMTSFGRSYLGPVVSRRRVTLRRVFRILAATGWRFQVRRGWESLLVLYLGIEPRVGCVRFIVYWWPRGR